MRIIDTLSVLVVALAASASADTYTVTFPTAVTDRPPATGRVILFFITETGPRWSRGRPVHGPFFSKPQPIASVAVENFKPGESVTLDGTTFAFPDSLDTLEGTVRVQAILDADDTERSHLDGPGNMMSQVQTVELAADRDDHIALTLTQPVGARHQRVEAKNLRYVSWRSERLSAFYGRDVSHRAGLAFPAGYFREGQEERRWPAVYVVPGYGGREEGARSYARMFQVAGTEDLAPQAVHIVLDPESPLGHHGFVDSTNHGPRGTALVKEFIPYLEREFRLVARPEARLVTGHSSGGWSSLWLQLRWPEVFGGCWSTAPDPIDFSAFQMSNLYEDANLYTGADGTPTPSFRMVGPEGRTKVMMTVRQEGLMEYAMHPLGGSGQQWDAWEAMFSPRDPVTGYPRPMFDGRTGVIDKEVVEHWRRFDIARLVADDWSHYGPIVMSRVRLSCGTLDSFYLQRAVERFKTLVEQRAEETGGWTGPGYVQLVPDASHGDLRNYIFQQINQEMRAHLKEHGLGE